MGWTELRERSAGEGMTRVKALLKETKENLEELCEMVDEMGGSYGERGMYGDRDDNYGERDAWRIERERRGGGRRY